LADAGAAAAALPDDEPISDADRAAIARALAEPGIAISADDLTALLAAGGNDTARELIAAGEIAKARGYHGASNTVWQPRHYVAGSDSHGILSRSSSRFT